MKLNRRYLTFIALSALFVTGLVGCAGSPSHDDAVEASASNDAAPAPTASDDGTEVSAEDAVAGGDAQTAATDAQQPAPEAAKNDAIDSTDTQPMALDAPALTPAAETAAPAAAEPVAAEPAVAPVAQEATEAEVIPPAAPIDNPSLAKTQPAQAEMKSAVGAGEKVYVVMPGETLGTIAKKIYGKSSKWHALASGNNLKNPNKIYAGDILHYDASHAVAVYKTKGQPHKQVKVKRGESLSRLASRIYGSDQYWKMIWHYNSDLISDPNKIRAGQVLKYVVLERTTH